MPDKPTDNQVCAVEFLTTGEWQRAHTLVDDDRSALGAWLHGIVHTLEGDLTNARYWYNAAGREFPGADRVQREIAAAREAMGRGPAPAR